MGFKRGKGSFDNNGNKNKETATETPAAVPGLPTDGDLAKVRELLVGTQLQAQHEELARLEAKIVQQTSYVREDMGKNIANLERVVATQTGTALERCNSETNARKAADDSLRKKIEEIGHNFDSKLAEIEENSKRIERELRDQILSQCKLLSDVITTRHEEAVRMADEGVQAVKAAKVDRSALSALLVELGIRLDSEAAAKSGATIKD